MQDAYDRSASEWSAAPMGRSTGGVERPVLRGLLPKSLRGHGLPRASAYTGIGVS